MGLYNLFPVSIAIPEKRSAFVLRGRSLLIWSYQIQKTFCSETITPFILNLFLWQYCARCGTDHELINDVWFYLAAKG